MFGPHQKEIFDNSAHMLPCLVVFSLGYTGHKTGTRKQLAESSVAPRSVYFVGADLTRPHFFLVRGAFPI